MISEQTKLSKEGQPSNNFNGEYADQYSNFWKEEDSYVEKKKSLSFSHVERECFKVSHVRVQGVKKRECLGMVLGIT